MIGRREDNPWGYRIPARHVDLGPDVAVGMLDKVFEALSVPESTTLY
jgi:hypothetical protein